jgi:DNA-binding CsgD family transcriptional regulator
MANAVAQSFLLEECASRASLEHTARATRRGFHSFMLCVNRRMPGLTSAYEVPVLCVSSGSISGIVREWSTSRHRHDPLRRMAARGQIDSYMAQPLVWENDAGSLSIPGATGAIDPLSEAEFETMKWVYSCGVRTGMNIRVPSADRSLSIIASFFSDQALEDLAQFEDTVAICHFLSHMIYHELRDVCGLQRASPAVHLSPRERECLDWVAKGKSAGEMAMIMGLSVETVRDHLKRVRGKLNASTRAQALMRAVELGMIGPGH